MAVTVLELIKAVLKLKLLSLNTTTVLCNNFHTGIPQYRSQSLIEELATQEATDASNQLNHTLVDSSKWLKFKHQIRDSSQKSTNNSPTFGEVLYIFRPLVYLLSMYYFGEKSWKAWLISLVGDVSSIGHSLSSVPSVGNIEREEVLRRFGALFYYILRSPFFEYIVSKNGKLKSKILQLPFGETALEIINLYISYYRSHYFYLNQN